MCDRRGGRRFRECRRLMAAAAVVEGVGVAVGDVVGSDCVVVDVELGGTDLHYCFLAFPVVTA